jgi:hypothetical protein
VGLAPLPFVAIRVSKEAMSAVPESVQRWLDFLTVDPEAQNIQSAVAVSLAKLRENGAVSQQDAKSLMLLAQSLNPRSMPAVVTEWMDQVRRGGDHSPSGDPATFRIRAASAFAKPRSAAEPSKRSA